MKTSLELRSRSNGGLDSGLMFGFRFLNPEAGNQCLTSSVSMETSPGCCSETEDKHVQVFETLDHVGVFWFLQDHDDLCLDVDLRSRNNRSSARQDNSPLRNSSNQVQTWFFYSPQMKQSSLSTGHMIPLTGEVQVVQSPAEVRTCLQSRCETRLQFSPPPPGVTKQQEPAAMLCSN